MQLHDAVEVVIGQEGPNPSRQIVDVELSAVEERIRATVAILGRQGGQALEAVVYMDAFGKAPLPHGEGQEKGQAAAVAAAFHQIARHSAHAPERRYQRLGTEAIGVGVVPHLWPIGLEEGSQLRWPQAGWGDAALVQVQYTLALLLLGRFETHQRPGVSAKEASTQRARRQHAGRLIAVRDV